MSAIPESPTQFSSRLSSMWWSNGSKAALRFRSIMTEILPLAVFQWSKCQSCFSHWKCYRASTQVKRETWKALCVQNLGQTRGLRVLRCWVFKWVTKTNFKGKKWSFKKLNSISDYAFQIQCDNSILGSGGINFSPYSYLLPKWDKKQPPNTWGVSVFYL